MGWTTVAKVNDLQDGSGMVVSAGDKEIALFKVEGKFYALDNTCPHSGGPLGEGTLEGLVVTCPWHGWQFNVADGKCLLNPSITQPCYRVQAQGEEIQVEV